MTDYIYTVVDSGSRERPGGAGLFLMTSDEKRAREAARNIDGVLLKQPIEADYREPQQLAPDGAAVWDDDRHVWYVKVRIGRTNNPAVWMATIPASTGHLSCNVPENEVIEEMWRNR